MFLRIAQHSSEQLVLSLRWFLYSGFKSYTDHFSKPFVHYACVTVSLSLRASNPSRSPWFWVDGCLLLGPNIAADRTESIEIPTAPTTNAMQIVVINDLFEHHRVDVQMNFAFLVAKKFIFPTCHWAKQPTFFCGFWQLSPIVDIAIISNPLSSEALSSWKVTHVHAYTRKAET